MSTETTNKKIKIDNGATFGKTYTDKAIDAKLPTDLIASANKLSLGVGNAPLGNGVNLSGFTYDEATKTLKASGGGGITTANINPETSQLDTSSLTAKDQYILASMDDGEGNISYKPLQTSFLSDGYFNKEVALQISSHDFRLSLTNVSFSSVDNYTMNPKNTNVDFINTLDSTNTWTKLGDVKYITIEEQNLLTGESTHKYLEISGGGSALELDGGRIQYFSGNRYFPPINLTNEQVETIRTKYANKEPFLIKLKYEDNSTSNYFIELNAQNLSARIGGYNNELGSLYTLIAFDSPNPLSFLIEIDLYGKSISVTEQSFLYLDSTRVGINLNVKNALQLQYVRNGAWSPVSDYAIYFDEINGKPIIHSESNTKNYTFTEDKTISLFGKHSILVPNNSADTAIDLYIHNIVLKDNAETTTKKIYLTIQSATNTSATTKELLQTLLGSTSRYIRVSGYTPTNDISAINWTGTFDTSKYDVRGTETSLTDFTVIEDSVVTL